MYVCMYVYIYIYICCFKNNKRRLISSKIGIVFKKSKTNHPFGIRVVNKRRKENKRRKGKVLRFNIETKQRRKEQKAYHMYIYL